MGTHAHGLSCVRLCDPMDCSLPGSSVHGIFQARILEWVATSYSRECSQSRDRTPVSCIGGFLTVEPPGKHDQSCERQLRILDGHTQGKEAKVVGAVYSNKVCFKQVHFKGYKRIRRFLKGNNVSTVSSWESGAFLSLILNIIDRRVCFLSSSLF